METSMTKKELSQLYWLNKEIKQYKKKLKELEDSATNDTSGEITGMPNGHRCTDKIGNCAAEIGDLKALIKLSMHKRLYELNRLNRFINLVEDSEMRTILNLYYVDGMNWREIAMDLGYADESVPRKRHDRFLKMTEKSG
ncbi:hypothetical protein SAMN04488579_10293 [Eubacterium barkeri]|uniref:Phage transcriptional activator, RinA family n=2 Tax=Eubacterium barkeri TaxID=1528 RepID=A0A1H3BIG3_EUBBA|nr:hypothetical protein SAMN04488579_10293 [Eubacterium barkeri]